MKVSEFIARWAMSPTGVHLDRSFVRATGHSFVSWIFARHEGVLYNPPLLLTTLGAVTGRKRTVVLPYFSVEDRLCVVGSRGGLPNDPYWARNLRSNPRSWIRLDGKLQRVCAEFAQDEEWKDLWGKIAERSPIYLEYQRRAEPYRQIPVIILRPTQ